MFKVARRFCSGGVLATGSVLDRGDTAATIMLLDGAGGQSANELS